MTVPTRPRKMATLVAQRIVADIHATGNISGSKLAPEQVMLETYGVGRGTLRESLRFLELQGVIVLRPGPGGGPVVQNPDASSLETTLLLLLQFSNAPFRTIAEARAGLEPMMAQLAAERMDDDQRTALRISVEDMSKNIDDQMLFLDANKRFHDIIAHGSGNALFGYLVDAMLGILDGSAIGIDYPEVRRKAVSAAHVRIYEAIESRDPVAASSTMRDHIAEYLKYAEAKFPEVLDSPVVWGQGT